ncbi:MAG TPA: Fic family protein [Thermoanaerobaculia bacterium]|nr:Fic family protein [Thermoanaerobaculia bacterium]
MRRRAAEAAEARMVKQRERGRPRLRKQREQEEAEQESMAKTLLGFKKPQAIYDTLGPEDKWREHIDGRHQHHGKNVYVKGFHGRRPDPEYNKRMMEADRYVSSTFGRQFNVEDYLELRKRIAKPGDMGAYPRKGELALRYDEFLDPISTLSSEKDPYVKKFDPDYEHPETQEHSAAVVLRDVEDPIGEIDSVLGGHYKSIDEAESEDDKMEVIARTHRQLENLHPFVDYNSRTNRLVLNRLLAEQNLPPTILHNPLDVHRMSSTKWIEQIKKGQKDWMKQAERVEEGRMRKDTSAEDEWKKHDRMQEFLKRYGQI